MVMASGVLDAKLMPPPPQTGSLRRTALVERARRDERQVVLVTAPAGYGKTTFLRQWAEVERREVAWVSLEPTDDDAAALVRYLALALDRIEPLAPGVLSAPGDVDGPLRLAALTRLADALWRGSRPVVLMLDDVHHLRTAGCTDTLMWLSEHLPPRIRLVLAGRSEAPVPIARLRARGQLLEIAASDLAMSLDETRDLLAQAGVTPDDDRVARIAERTEGWAAGIYLTALALGAGGRESPIDHGPDAPVRYVDEFLHAEVLGRLPEEEVAFMCATAPLVRFDAAMCDHLLERRGSADLLADLARTNRFLIPLDGDPRSYRYHHLFREALLRELRTRMPGRERVVLRRAAEWCADHADPDAAVEYAHQAGADHLLASLLEAHTLSVFRSGRIATLDRWFDWFDDAELQRLPRLAIMGAWIWVMSGRTARAERWADAVAGTVGDLDPIARSRFAALRSVMGRMSPEELLDEARIAMVSLPTRDDWQATAFLGGGALRLMLGDVDQADALLVRATDIGLDRGGIPALTTALGMRAHIAIGRGAWDIAHEHVRRARGLITQHGLEAYATSALPVAVGARIAVHRGAADAARADIQTVQRLRPTLSAALPYLSALVRLEVAHAYLGTGEVEGAHLMLTEIDDIIALRPGLAPMAAEVAALRARVGEAVGHRGGPTTLTTAELRLLGFLPSHLSLREIASRLFVSINTVKTQAISIYAKLGVSSRSEAVEAAVAAGLLDPSVLRFPVDSRQVVSPRAV